jgi:hypothetical protein
MAYRGNKVLGAFAAMVALTAISPHKAAAQLAGDRTIAILDRMQADVRIFRGKIALKGAAKQPLLKADLVQTGTGARALIRFIDGSLLTLGELAEAFLDDYAMHAQRRSGTMFVDIVKGAFRFRSGRIGDISDKRVEIRTSVVNLTLRNNAGLWGGPIDGSHGIMALSGVVEVRNDAGSVVLSRERLGTMVMSLGHPPDSPKIWGRDKIRRANAMVNFK